MFATVLCCAVISLCILPIHGHHATFSLDLSKALSVTAQNGAESAVSSWDHDIRVMKGVCYNPRVTISVLYHTTNNPIQFSVNGINIGTTCSPTQPCSIGRKTCIANASLSSLADVQAVTRVNVIAKPSNNSFCSTTHPATIDNHIHNYIAFTEVTLTCSKAPTFIPVQSPPATVDANGKLVMSSGGSIDYAFDCSSLHQCDKTVNIHTPPGTMCSTTMLSIYENGQALAKTSSFELTINGQIVDRCEGTGTCNPYVARMCVAPHQIFAKNVTSFLFGMRLRAATSSCTGSVHGKLLMQLRCQLVKNTGWTPTTTTTTTANPRRRRRRGGRGGGSVAGVIIVVVCLLAMAAAACVCYQKRGVWGSAQSVPPQQELRQHGMANNAGTVATQNVPAGVVQQNGTYTFATINQPQGTRGAEDV